MVGVSDVSRAVRELGICEGDIVLIHSSLRSLGKLENGPDTVIDGFEAVLGAEGTLVLPTLCQKDFENSYKTWHMDKPSDVGYLTEYFRKLPGVLRSDQATHSVAARGKYAHELTYEHTAYGPHLCPFGETAFMDSSPWLKMLKMGTKTVFIGVSTRYNTMKHTVEAKFVEDVLAKVQDESVRAELQSQVAAFGKPANKKVWPMYNGILMHDEYERSGLIRHAKCGDAELYCIDMKETWDASYKLLSSEPEKWCNEETLCWIERCKANY